MKNTGNVTEMNRGGGVAAAAMTAAVREDFSYGDHFVVELHEAMNAFHTYRSSKDYHYLHNLIGRVLGFNVRYNRQSAPCWMFLTPVGDPRTVLTLGTINEAITWTNHTLSSDDCSGSFCFDQVLACQKKIWDGFSDIRQRLLGAARARRIAMTISEDLAVLGAK